MNSDIAPSHEEMVAVAKREGRRDALVRRIRVGAWAVTGGAVTIVSVATGVDVWRYFQLAKGGLVRWPEVLDRLIPLAAALGFVGLLVAGASTVATLLRRETTSLSEIRSRLAGLEQLTETSELLEQHVRVLRDEMVELNERVDVIDGALTRHRRGEVAGSRSPEDGS
jgi:hypothetical protein